MHPYSDSDFDDNVVFRSRQTDQEESIPNHDVLVPAPTSETAFNAKKKAAGAEFVSRILWFATVATIAVLFWQMMPRLVENYQYSATRGRIRAEYENAVHMLAENPLESVSNAYELVAQKIRPSVVSIQTTVPNTEAGAANRQRFFSQVPESMRGQGSGVIISAEGYILTNAHVIAGAEEISVILHNRRKFVAKQVGKSDTLNDLAVLKIEAPDLVAAEWGDSEALHVGSIIWAIGSPYGYDQTVTSGIVSAKNRARKLDGQSLNGHQQMLQTDAAVNPGNSGGPLVNSLGQVVGINTAIYGKQFQGISFAVPSVVARFVYEETVEKGYVARSVLGVYVDAVYQEYANHLNLPDIDGALVTNVVAQSPAQRAGLRRGDIIRSFNGKSLGEFALLYRYIDMTTPGSEVTLNVLRNGVEREVRVVVEARSNYLREN